MTAQLYPTIQEKNPSVAKWLYKFFKKEPQWNDLNAVNLKKFNEFLTANLSPNSVKTYIAELKAVINLYKGVVEMPSVNFQTTLKTKAVRSTHCYLTTDELQQIEQLNNLSPRHKDIRDLFLLQAWTGCRMSDAVQLTPDNISNGLLAYTSQKTQIYATIPAKPLIREIVSRIAEIETPNKVTYNRVVRELCRRAGVSDKVNLFKSGKKVSGPKYDFVSSHTARRSFATNLYEAGIHINKISYMMGHSETTMTERYICSNMEINNELVEFFK